MRRAAFLLTVIAGIVSIIVGGFAYHWFDDLLSNRPQNTTAVEQVAKIKISNPPREVVVEPPPPERAPAG